MYFPKNKIIKKREIINLKNISKQFQIKTMFNQKVINVLEI